MNFVPKTLTNIKSKFRTRSIEFSVEISQVEQIVDTREGPVACEIGDAIVTGIEGERWPVPASKFDEKYQPSQGQDRSANGRYTKRIRDVEAVQLYEPLKVQLTEGRGELSGEPGDWCVWYSESDLAIVASNIFPKLYESEALPVYIELHKELTDTDKRSALLAIQKLSTALPSTPIVFTEEVTNNQQPTWFCIVKDSTKDHRVIPDVIELTVESVVSQSETGLVSIVKKSLLKDSVWTLTKRELSKLLPSFSKETKEASLESVVAKQLAAVERFNVSLVAKRIDPLPFIDNIGECTEVSGLLKVSSIGAVADDLATANQTKWQKLVFATTKEITSHSILKWFGNVHRSLVPLGLLAALMLTAFSELSGTCDVNDPLGFKFCASSTWEHWAGPFFLFVYLTALGTAWIHYAKAKSEQWEICHQDYRLLAECLRVLHVRALLGKPACVAADLPLAEPADSGWVQLALRSIFFDVQQSSLPSTTDETTQVDRAMNAFVVPQVQYHENTLLVRREQAIEHLSIAARRWLTLFFLILVTLTANVIAEIFHHQFLSPMMHHAALIGLVFSMVSWGSMRKVMDSYGLEQELQRGRLVLSNLVQAEQLRSSESILRAAKFFLDDQANWHALHRSKPIEAATGG